MTETEPCLFFTDGEAVDFRHAEPTWRNIRLVKTGISWCEPMTSERIRNIEKFNKVGTLCHCPGRPLCETVSPRARTPIPCLSISEVLKKRRPAVLEHRRAPDHSQLSRR
jgi:hypothetical protein